MRTIFLVLLLIFFSGCAFLQDLATIGGGFMVEIGELGIDEHIAAATEAAINYKTANTEEDKEFWKIKLEEELAIIGSISAQAMMKIIREKIMEGIEEKGIEVDSEMRAILGE